MQSINAAHRAHSQGASQHADGDLAGAIEEFTRAIESNPDAEESWNNRGACRFQAGDVHAALDDLERAIEINPRYAEAHFNRAIVRQSLGQLNESLIDFDLAIAIHPRYVDALCGRGKTRRSMGDLDGAIADFDRAVGISPEHADARFGRAEVLHCRGELEGGLRDCGRLLEIVPRQAAAPVHHLRSAIHATQAQWAKMIAECNQAIEIDPNFCMAYISRANARFHQRDPAGYTDYLTAFRLDRSATVTEILRIVVTDIEQGAESVLENCRKHLVIHADDAIAYARRGMTLFVLGRESEAARDLEQAVSRIPGLKLPLDLVLQKHLERPQPGISSTTQFDKS